MEKREDNKQRSSNDYSVNSSGNLNTDELIENIRDKIQRTLKQKAEKEDQPIK